MLTSIATIVFLSIIGLMFGNYATTLFYRIPNGKPINGLKVLNGQKPHCSHCGHELKFYEYLPLLSWFSTSFKCNYCSTRIDCAYTILEVYNLFAALLLYFWVGLNFQYVFLLCNVSCLSLFLALLIRHRRIYFRILFLQIFLGVILWGTL